jgi:cation transport regulator ChaB
VVGTKPSEARVSKGCGPFSPARRRTPGDAPQEDPPTRLQRSPEEARRTWIKAHDSAVEEDGEGERAHRVAYGALKHEYEKAGDHWERKEGGQRPLRTALGPGRGSRAGQR